MKVYSLMLGSYQTNCYLAADDDGVCASSIPAIRQSACWRQRSAMACPSALSC